MTYLEHVLINVHLSQDSLNINLLIDVIVNVFIHILGKLISENVYLIVIMGNTKIWQPIDAKDVGLIAYYVSVN